MHLSVYAQFNLKEIDDYRGLRGDSLSIGKKESVSFADMARVLLVHILSYYIRFADAATLNAELDTLRASLATWKVVETCMCQQHHRFTGYACRRR